MKDGLYTSFNPLPKESGCEPPLKWLPIEALSVGGPPLLRKLLRLGLVR